MQNKTTIFLSLLMLVFAAGSVSAQNNAISPYSRFGIGEIEYQNNGRSKGMGGVQTALNSPFNINSANPASYAVFIFPENSIYGMIQKKGNKPNGRPFLFQVSGRAARSDMSNAEEQNTRYQASFVSLSARFQLQNFWSASFGIKPYSSIGYNITSYDSVSSNGYTSGLRSQYIGSGGINNLYIGNAFYFKGLSVGFNASYLFGPVEQNALVLLKDDNYTAVTSDLTRSNIGDFHFRSGIQYTNDSIFGNFGLTLGGYFENKQSLKAEQSRLIMRGIDKYSSGLSDTLLNISGKDGSIEMPLRYGAGLSVHGKSFCIAADYTISDWTDVKILGESSEFLTKAERYSFGAEYTPDLTSKSYFKTVNYRLGGHFSNTNLVFGQTQLQEKGVSIGFGIPVLKSMTRINIALEAGLRGTTEQNLVKENYYKFHIFVNTGDIWFQKRKFN